MDLSRLMDNIVSAPRNVEMDLKKGVSHETSENNGGTSGFEKELSEQASRAEDRQAQPVAESKLPKKEALTSEKADQDAKPVVSSNEEGKVPANAKAESESSVDDVKPASELAAFMKKAGIEDVSLEGLTDESIDELSKKLETLVASFLKQSGLSLEDLQSQIKETGKLPAELQTKIDELQMDLAAAKVIPDHFPLNIIVQQGIENAPKPEINLGVNEQAPKLIEQPVRELLQNLKKSIEQPDQKSSHLDQLALNSKPIDSKMESLIRQMNSVHQKLMDGKSIIRQSDVKNLMDGKLNPVSAEVNQKQNVELGVVKPSRVKDLADGLFIQKNIQQSDPSLGLGLLNRSEVKLATPNLGFSQSLRTNLVEDMQAHVQKALVTKEGGQINLTLRPGNLGEVKIDLRMDGQTARLSMETEKSAAQSVLKSQIHELKGQLSQMGIKLDDIQVTQSRSSQSGSEHPNQQMNQQQMNQQQRDAQSDRQNQRQAQLNESSQASFDFEDQFHMSRSVA